MYCAALTIPYPNLRFFPKPTAKQLILFGLGCAPAAKIASPRIEKVAQIYKKVAPSGKKVVTSSNALFFYRTNPILTFPYEGKERANIKCRDRNPTASLSELLHPARERLEGVRQLCICSGGFVAANKLSVIAVRGDFSALNSEGARTARAIGGH